MIDLSKFFRKISRTVEINFKQIPIKNLSKNFENFKIVQISDLHINRFNVDFIEKTINIVNNLEADIITITGDIICNGKKYLPELSRMFKNLSAKHGKYACLGNHDHSDGDDSLKIRGFYKKNDINLLVNDYHKFVLKGESLYFAGADDIELGEQNLEKSVNQIPKENNLIYLTHNPINFEDIAKLKADFVMAGHTHGMQFYLPLLQNYYKKRLGTAYIAGEYRYQDSLLYVNKGLGTSLISPEIFGKKVTINTPRINTKPEITLFELKSDKKTS
ncbi:MAG: metallophosphoesterase [Candidatus Gastranaerophilales bacterium]|nr:metallophosphoesterase [Candidatus Gastranaerophilales bacterium]